MIATPIVPLLKIQNCLLGSIQHGLHDRRALELKDYLLSQVYEIRPKAIILDFSAIPLIDSFLSRILLDTFKATKLMGCRLFLCNLPDTIIIVMVELGIVVPASAIAINLDYALEEANAI